MLSLEPPFLLIRGVTVFRDHADSLQWYYLPISPHFVEIDDGGAAIPQFSLIKFRGTAGTGGFLNFDVSCGLTNGALDDLAHEIMSKEHLAERPRLSPVPLTDGTVKLIILDRQSGDTVPGTTPPVGTGIRFVEQITHEAHPALYGDNRAAFSVQLTDKGVTLVEKAMAGELSPIAVVYSLEFLGLRQAYEVSLTIDWARVQKHLEEKFGFDSIFFSADIENAVDKLVDDRAIEFSATTFVAEGDENKGVLGRRDQALQQVKAMITQAFFEPSLNPTVKEKDGWDKAIDTVTDISRLAVTGGGSSLGGGFTWSKKDYTRMDDKTLNVHMSERTTVRQKIYPQAHLSGVARLLRDSGVPLSRFVTEVTLDDPWFERRTIRVIPRADLAIDKIASISARVSYDNTPKSLVFDTTAKEQVITWPSVVANGVMRRPATARFTVNFADGSHERPRSLSSDEVTIDTDTWELFPRDLYAVTPVAIAAVGVPWDRYQQVEVAIEYADPAHGTSVSDVVVLRDKAESVTWPWFTVGENRSPYRYQLTYRALNNRDHVTAWVESDDDVVTVRNPFPSTRVVEVATAVPWTEAESVFVDLTYADPANSILEERSLTFDTDHKGPQTFAVPLQDPTIRRVDYRITVIGKDGSVTEVPTSSTLDRRIVVKRNMKGHTVCQIALEDVDFHKRGVTEVVADVRYEEPNEGLSYADTFSLKAPTDVASFEFDFTTDNVPHPEVRYTTKFENGMSSSTDWTKASSDHIRIPVGSPN
jgi:hypothetical protein